MKLQQKCFGDYLSYLVFCGNADTAIPCTITFDTLFLCKNNIKKAKLVFMTDLIGIKHCRADWSVTTVVSFSSECNIVILDLPYEYTRWTTQLCWQRWLSALFVFAVINFIGKHPNNRCSGWALLLHNRTVNWPVGGLLSCWEIMTNTIVVPSLLPNNLLKKYILVVLFPERNLESLQSIQRLIG